MSIFNKTDVELLNKSIESIQEQVEIASLEQLEPSIDERKRVTDIIINFIKTNKRKIYGGYAINKLLSELNPENGIYKEHKFPDIDFYSSTPIDDLTTICKELHSHGFKKVNGREARHIETYSIYVNYQLYCDITYVPRNVYNKIPFKTIDNLVITHPSFIMIDYFRMITDPLASYWRLEKAFKRFVQLMEAFPLPEIKKPIFVQNTDYTLKKAINVVNKFIINRESCINIGFYAYLYYINKSKIIENKHYSNKITKLIDIPFFEIISIDYKNDYFDLKELLEKEFPGSQIEVKEYFPFFQFTNYSVEIYLNSELICIIYSNNKKCLPYHKVDALTFEDGKATKENGSILLGSFSLTLLYSQIQMIRHRTNDDNELKNLYMSLSYYLTKVREYYFEKNKYNIMSPTIFAEFVVKCKGLTVHPDRELMLRYEERRQKNKRVQYIYDPSKEQKDTDNIYYFSNSSGNPIINDRNLQLKSRIDEEETTHDSVESEEEPDSNESE